MKTLLGALGQPIFNGYDVLILTIFIESVIFSAFYFFHSQVLIQFYARSADESKSKLRRRRYSAVVLSGFMLLVGVSELVFLLTYNATLSGWVANNIGIWSFSLIALVFFFPGALLFRYVTSLIYRRNLSRYFFLIPVALFFMALMVDFLGLFDGRLQEMFWRPYVLVATVAFALNAVLAVLTLWHLRRYQKQVQHYFGNLDAVDARWLVIVTGGFGLIWTMALIPPFIPQEDRWLVLQQVIIHLPSVLEVILLTVAILFGLSQGVRIVNVFPDRKTTDIPEVPREPEFDSALLTKLEHLMVEENWYRRADITVDQFAEAAGVSVKLVSHAINRHFEKNFYEFVNHYRIEEIKSRLKHENPSRVPIQKIYEDAGFRSKSSFNTLFRKWVGMTPSQYRKKFGVTSVRPLSTSL